MAARRTRTKASGAARASTDHDEIREWAEEKGAHPAIVKGTGILRLDFPGFSGEETLAPITWDEFFERFEESSLALLYQDTTGSGRDSTFNKLVHRDTLKEKRAAPRRSRSRRSSARPGVKRARKPTTKAPARKASARKAPARKTPARKASARKTPARKAPAKKRRRAGSKSTAR